MNSAYSILAARVCLSLIFLNAGINHLTGFSGFQGTIAGLGLPLAPVVAIAAIILLLLGGLSLLLGFKPRIGAILLIAFLIPTTLIVHNPLAPDAGWSAFLKNLGLIGGLLTFFHLDAGALSLDGVLSSSQDPTSIAQD